MILKVFGYKDIKLNVFSNPFYIDGGTSKEDMIEKTRRMCASGQLPSYFFEYDLYELGQFDDKVGEFTTHSPEFIVSLGDFKHLAPVPDVKKEEVNNVVS